MTAPLAGLRVLDLTSGPAGGLATMILSDFGAHVQRFPDPEYAELSEMVSARMWLRGKEIAHFPFHDVVHEADVVVITTPHGFSGCDFTSLHRMNPQLIYAEICALPGYPDIPVMEPV
ncbi:MAG: CoA transferase, partial [Pseudomonadales bacterium]|nr:CoA transferase [Pseudomonadales bacterium]